MAFGKSSLTLLSLGCLALINYTSGECTVTLTDGPTSTVSDDAPITTNIATFTFNSPNTPFPDNYDEPVITDAENYDGLFTTIFYTQDTNAIYSLVVGPNLANYVDINGGLNPFRPEFSLACPEQGQDDIGSEALPDWNILVTDGNNQIPVFLNVPDRLTFDLTKWSEDNNQLSTDPFRVRDADSTLDNVKVTITVEGQLATNITLVQGEDPVEGEKETEFTLSLKNNGIAPGFYSFNLLATNTAENGLQANKTVNIILNGAMQQAGTFFMVMFFSVLATVFAKY